MALHQKATVKENLLDDIYASTDLSVRMPKYRFPEKEHDPRHVYQAVHDELMLDGNSRQNLATFCSTWIEPEVYKLMDECVDKNMIDKDEYPQTAEIEARCVHMLADLWNSPDAAQHHGVLHHRFQRGGHVGRNGHEMAVAGEDAHPGESNGQTQSDMRSGADLLA